MLNLADLPPELFDIILTHALGEDEDINRLCGLCLLSRKWYTAVIDRVYSKWTFNGARQPFLTLWKFLMTVLRDRHLASQVRTLRIGNWGFFPNVSLPSSDLQLPSDELDVVRLAIHDAGIAHLEKSIMASLRKRDRRPLMAILLTCLPNLETVFAHVPRSDPFLAAVFKRAVDSESDEARSSLGLHRLRALHLCQETPVDTPRQPEDSEPDSDDEESVSRTALRLEYLWPVFYLRNLRALSLVDMDTVRAAGRLKDRGISRIEDLYLINNWTSLGRSSDVQALIDQPTALRTFALALHDNPFGPNRHQIISNSELWVCLQKYQHTLETVDICRSKNTHREENGHFGLLRTFPNLKHLRIQSEMLLGGCCGSPRASFRLKDTLPPTIETLTLYGEEGFDIIPDMHFQLRELISGENHFPSLNTIVLDDMTSLYDHDVQQLLPQYKDLGRLCRDSGIVFRIEEAVSMLGGMLGYQTIWGKALHMQMDGEARDAAVSYIPKNLRDRQELLLRSEDAMDDDNNDEEEEEEEESDSDDDKPDESNGVSKYPESHPIPFTDHSGKTAHMVFDSGPLPPLFSFAIYFTHPNATPANTDMKSLARDLTPENYFIRHDMYFLPGASPDDCITHYENEKTTRGSYKDQIKSFRACPRSEIHPLPGTTGQIPGMVNRYPMLGPYRGVLFVSLDESWHGGGLLRVMFDRKTVAETQAPPVTVRHCPINMLDATFGPGVPTVWETVFDIAHREQGKYLAPWRRARRRGWRTW
ncbi:hypothetical protein BJX76DRAFT_62377 [Aspergillus varians]